MGRSVSLFSIRATIIGGISIWKVGWLSCFLPSLLFSSFPSSPFAFTSLPILSPAPSNSATGIGKRCKQSSRSGRKALIVRFLAFWQSIETFLCCCGDRRCEWRNWSIENTVLVAKCSSAKIDLSYVCVSSWHRCCFQWFVMLGRLRWRLWDRPFSPMS